MFKTKTLDMRKGLLVIYHNNSNRDMNDELKRRHIMTYQII